MCRLFDFERLVRWRQGQARGMQESRRVAFYHVHFTFIYLSNLLSSTIIFYRYISIYLPVVPSVITTVTHNNTHVTVDSVDQWIPYSLGYVARFCRNTYTVVSGKSGAKQRLVPVDCCFRNLYLDRRGRSGQSSSAVVVNEELLCEVEKKKSFSLINLVLLQHKVYVASAALIVFSTNGMTYVEIKFVKWYFCILRVLWSLKSSAVRHDVYLILPSLYSIW